MLRDQSTGILQLMGNRFKTFSLPESLAALRSQTERLASATLTGADLLEVEQIASPHLHGLIDYFINADKLSFELEDQVWVTVYRYLKYMVQGADALLKAEVATPTNAIADVLATKIDVMAKLAKWHYFRYRPLPANFWLNMHRTYALAEKYPANETAKPVSKVIYLNALLLDSLNRSNMQKAEIEHIDSWLRECSKGIMLERQCNELKHLLFVDLESQRSAQRIREYETREHCRYWSMESIITQLVDMRMQIEQGAVPTIFAKDMALPSAKRLLDQLSSEWSYQSYKRQRRNDDREDVTKLAQAVHGLMNVCQHIKNNAYNQLVAPLKNLLRAENSWRIENESKYGFGAQVNSGLNLWLKPGVLISLDYELNPDMIAVGVVRNIQQQQGTDCYAGIEVLSYTPTYVTLRVQGDAMATSSPALYLANDEERKLPASLIMARYDYIERGRYLLKMDSRVYDAQIATLMEQHEDWIRVSVTMAPNHA
jgi:hypothetical protein